jgi:primosomal protein N' (replication factor Y)
VWQALPGEDWPARLAEAAAAAHRAGRGALLIVPDARDLERLDAALTAALPPRAHLVLSADLGPAERYRRFLAVLHGRVRVVAGTRAAAFAPVRDPALLAVFDDGDDLLAEPRAPYPHVREVLMLRSAQQGAALLIGGFARTAEAQLLLDAGWAHPIIADRTELRRRMPRIEAAGDDFAVGADSPAAHARLSPAAFAAARASLAADAPVLVQVPRRGYLPGLACADCRRPARCRQCQGPLALARGARFPGCRWCGRAEPNLRCRACGSDRVRATVAGASRTAEEIGRAFPGVRLRTSAGQSVLATVEAEPAIVVATPGAEPIADGGYGAALLLDGALLLGRADLRAAEEALRRWMAAAVLVRPASAGGRVVVGADGSIPTVQALVRWDPAWHASLELAGRQETGFPPAVAMASLEGSESAVGAALRELDLPSGSEVLGPVPTEPPPSGQGSPDGPEVRALLRTTAAHRKKLAAALRVLAAARSARKETAVRLRIDPAELG